MSLEIHYDSIIDQSDAKFLPFDQSHGGVIVSDIR